MNPGPKAKCSRIVYDNTHSSIPYAVVFHVNLLIFEDDIFPGRSVFRPVCAQSLMGRPDVITQVLLDIWICA